MAHKYLTPLCHVLQQPLGILESMQFQIVIYAKEHASTLCIRISANSLQVFILPAPLMLNVLALFRYYLTHISFAKLIIFSELHIIL